MTAEVTRKPSGSPLQAVEAVLAWLLKQPGDGWQERWQAGGADHGTEWVEEVPPCDFGSPRKTKRAQVTLAVSLLMVAGVVLPDYEYFSVFRSKDLFTWVRRQRSPGMFVRLEQATAEIGLQGPQASEALNAITKMVLHTGREPGDLTVEDIREQHAWLHRERADTRAGVSAGWDLLAHAGVVPERTSQHGGAGNGRVGQLTVEAMVDRWQIRCQPVRDVLVRYLSERAPAMDYGSLLTLASRLAGRFWADIEQHHPGIDSLRLPPETAEAWKQRLRTYTTADGEVRQLRDYLQILAMVRTFYLDIQEWALEDASWAAHAAPSPVRRSEQAGRAKARKKTVAEMHQRIRERLPHLQRLADSAADHRAAAARLLAAAIAAAPGGEFTHEGVTYRRVRKAYPGQTPRAADRIMIEDTATGEATDVTKAEEDAFWSWAVIETLRHTGCRVEELLEITQLAIVSYRLPATGETIPLLQIVPSKSNEERLLLVTPELASVLATIIKRQRDDNNGTVRLVSRYDTIEKVAGPPLPHLFQRKIGWRPMVIGPNHVNTLINDAIARAGITNAAGQPLRCTAHDFRRMFTTDAVTGGLPVHIAAKILGHRNLATLESYLAVFQDEMITAYRAYLGKRRALRPEAEYREPTAEEWREFEEHFEKRKLELGTCGRPYGTPCAHEHACIRCAMLRPDPAARGRLVEIIKNLADRISEARINGWLGEVEGLQVSLTAARGKLAALDRTARNTTGTADLGMPAFPPTSKERP